MYNKFENHQQKNEKEQKMHLNLKRAENQFLAELWFRVRKRAPGVVTIIWGSCYPTRMKRFITAN